MTNLLRLAVSCVVVDARSHVLLSKRGDLNIWNLPGGRLDSGELLAAAAVREVLEETGVEAQVQRAVGLYFMPDWERLVVLYTAVPVGGALLQATVETRANAYFSTRNLPSDLLNPVLIHDALAEQRPFPRLISVDPQEVQRIKGRLRWRWVTNLLLGRPEPRYPRFTVTAVALVWNSAHRRVLTLPGARGPQLPRIPCDSSAAPWEQLGYLLAAHFEVRAALCWVGVWQDTAHDRLEFVFAASIRETAVGSDLQWTVGQNTALAGRDARYVEQVKSTYQADPVWTLVSAKEDEIFDMILSG